MRYEILSHQKLNRVMLIKLHELETCYSDPAPLAHELNEFCTTICRDPEIRVAVISMEQTAPPLDIGLGRETMTYDPTSANPLSWSGPVSMLDIPVIMSINGYALGQALELALACDMRFAASNSFFGLPHITIGLIPWDGGTQRLARLVGKSDAMAMILTGKTINAKDALRIGLVNQLIKGKRLLPEILEMAQGIASKGPVALKFTKEVVHKGMDLSMDQALSLEADLYFLLHTSKDRTEGIKAFREKRKVQFKGE